MTQAHVTLEQRRMYEDKGYVLIRDVFQRSDFDSFSRAFLRLVEEQSGIEFPAPHDPVLRNLFDENRQVESRVHNALRDLPEIRQQRTDPRTMRHAHT